MTFKFDTSGTVRNTPPLPRQPVGQRLEHLRWSDLSPGVQGCIAAMMEEVSKRRNVIKAAIPADLINAIYKAEGWTKVEGEVRIRRANMAYVIHRDNRAGVYVATPKPLRFSDLHPDTLARIIADWAKYRAMLPVVPDTLKSGNAFYASRQKQFSGKGSAWVERLREAFPPLAIALDGEGKVIVTGAEAAP